MCNRYTPSDREHAHFRTWLSINPSDVPPANWTSIGPWGEGPFFADAVGHTVDWKVGQWGMIRPGNRQRWDEKAPIKGRPSKAAIRFQTNNCRCETMASARTFRTSWANDRRCIIPARSFYEPFYETGRVGEKAVWWQFVRADNNPWGIAGLWSEWTDPVTGEVVPNYTMITVNADDHPLMSRMHKPEFEADGMTLKVPQDKRSILVLEPTDWDIWLFGSKADGLSLLRLPSREVFRSGPAVPIVKSILPKDEMQQQSSPFQTGLF